MAADRTRSGLYPALAGMAGLLIGLGGGYLWRHAVKDEVASTVVQSSIVPPSMEKTPAMAVTPQGEPAPAPKPDASGIVAEELRSQDGEVHRKALVREIAKALSIRQPAERMRRFLAMMEHFRAGDSQAVVDGFRELDQKGRLFSAEFNVFMDLSGRVDGLNAMERVRTARYTSPDVAVLDHHVRCMTAWAETSASAAIDWWNHLEDGKFRDGMARAIIAGVSSTNMSRAVEYLKMFPEQERSQHAGTFMHGCLETGGLQHAVQWLKTVDMPSGESSPFHIKAAQTLLARMVNVSPAEKAAYFAPLLDQSWFAASGCIPRIVEEWTRIDPQSATEWSQRLTQ